MFLLHDVFDYSYDEIATIADKSQDNCRQLAVRARRHVEQEKPRFEASRHQRDELARRFFTAVAGDGCFDDLVKLLAADVVAYSDGGGKGPAALRPLYGRDRVVGLLDRLATSARSLGVRGQHTEINGQPGAMFFDRSDRLINVMTIDIADGMIESVRSVTNPEKLRHLESPLTDIQGLLHELTEPQGMTAASSPPSERREATQ